MQYTLHIVRLLGMYDLYMIILLAHIIVTVYNSVEDSLHHSLPIL